MVALTIGMPTYNDFDGVYFTIQALRLYQDLDDTELLVVDNYGCEHTRRSWTGGPRAATCSPPRRWARPRPRTGSLPRPRARRCSAVIPTSSSLPGIARLKAYYQEHPETRDLLQGPILTMISNPVHPFRPRVAGRDVGYVGNRPAGARSGGGAV